MLFRSVGIMTTLEIPKPHSCYCINRRHTEGESWSIYARTSIARGLQGGQICRTRPVVAPIAAASDGWTESYFALMDLPQHLQLRIVENPPFYVVATLRRTCHHFANIIPPIGKLKIKFEALHTEASAAGGNIDQMCENFKLSWFGNNYNVTYNEYSVLNKGCSCGRDATYRYSEASRR